MHTPWTNRAAAALLAMATTARAESNLCAWATFDAPTADSDAVPTASWGISPPCVSTGALYRTARLDITNGGDGIATNVEVVVHVDDRLLMVDAFSTPRNGSVHWADATFDPVVVRLPLMPTNQTVQVTLRVRARSWQPHGATPQNQWAWAEGAWPACEHVGGREIIPGVLYKQIWARDLYWALEERCQAVHTNGSLGVWNLANPSWVVGTLTNSVAPTWWTEAGVTNRVVRKDVATQDGSDDAEPIDGSFLEVAKVLAAALSRYYLDVDQIDPNALPASWHDFHFDHGARVDRPLSTNTFSAWVWECPGVAHTEAHTSYDQLRVSTNASVNWTSTSLPESLDLPRHLFGVTPYRFAEGICDPDSNPAAAAWAYRPGTVTGVCAWATFHAPEAEAGPTPSAVWHVAPGCIAGGDIDSGGGQAILKVYTSSTNLATNVVVRIDLDDNVEVVQVVGPGRGAAVQWYGAPGQPIYLRVPKFEANGDYRLTLLVRLRGAEGADPARQWYWSEFGWDALRRSIRELKALKFEDEPGANTFGTTRPVTVRWEWRGGGTNSLSVGGDSERNAWYVGPTLDSVLEDGDFNAAKDEALAADPTASLSAYSGPRYRYKHTYTARVPPATGTNLVYCAWDVLWSIRWNQPVLYRWANWPPTNVSVTVHALADVATRVEEEREAWSTELIGSVTWSSPATNEHVYSAVVGDDDFDLSHVPGDPSGGKGMPIIGEGIYQDFEPEGLAENRGNYLLNEREWADLFIVLEYDWSLP